MYRYRCIQVEFWQDTFIESISFEEKCFYQYLLTNPRTNQCGIYNFSIAIASVELSISKAKVTELLKKLINYGKILYDERNSEVMIVNWYKYNITSSRNTHICINKELKSIKTEGFIAKLYELCKKASIYLDTMFEGIKVEVSEEEAKLEEGTRLGEEIKLEDGTRLDREIKSEEGTRLDTEIKLEEGTRLDGERKKDKKVLVAIKEDLSMKKIKKAFDNNIHIASFIELQELESWTKDMGEELVLLAISEAVKHNVRNIKYINAILINWRDHGFDKVKQVTDYIKNRKKQTNKVESFGIPNAGAFKVVGEEV